MSGINASIEWSAIPLRANGPISVGYGMTDMANGGFAVASTSNLAASVSGVCKGVALTPSDGVVPFQLMVNGLLSPAQAPFVGTGNAGDFAVLDSTGRIIRSASFAAGVTVGLCGKDGSVLVSMTLTAPGATSINILPNASNASAGMVAVPAGSTLVPDTITVATTAARAGYNSPRAIYAAIAIAGIPALVYPMGSVVPPSVTGLGSGLRSLAVVTNTGTLARKDVPDLGDMVCGPVDVNGELHFTPTIVTGIADGENPGLRGPADFSVDVADILQRRIEGAYLDPTIMGAPDAAKTVLIEPGRFNLSHPLHNWHGSMTIRGSGKGCTTLQASGNWAGPVIHNSPRRESVNIHFNAFAGGNAMILDPPAAQTEIKYFSISDGGAGGYVHGLSTFEIHWIGKRTQAGSVQGVLISSSGSRYASDPGYTGAADTTESAAYVVVITSIAGGAGVYFQLQLSVSGLSTLTSPANSLPDDGVDHEVKCNYDGANMRIIIDNVVVATAAKTGTIVQQEWEMVNIGNGQCTEWGEELQTGTPSYELACIRMRDNVTQTTSGPLTLPTTKFPYPANDTHVIFTTNFDDFFPALQPFIITNVTNTNPMVVTTSTPHGFLTTPAVYPVAISGVGGCTAANSNWQRPIVLSPTTFSIPGAGNGAYTSGGIATIGGTFTKAWVRAQFGGTSQVIAYMGTIHNNVGIALTPDCSVSDMTIIQGLGDGISAAQSVRFRAERMILNTANGVRLRDNSYESVLEYLVWTSYIPIGTRFQGFGAFFGVADFMGTVRQCSFSNGGTAIVSVGSDISTYGCYFANNRRELMIYRAFNFNMYGMTSMSDEGSAPGTIDDQIALIGVANATFDGIQMTAANNAIPCIAIDQVNDFTRSVKVKIDGCLLQAVSPDGSTRTVPGLIKANSGNLFPLAGHVRISSCTQLGTLTIPFVQPTVPATFPVYLEPEGLAGTRTIALSDANYTMTRDDNLYQQVMFTGALTADRAITLVGPNLGPRWFINATTGGHNLTLVKSGGTNILTLAASPAATPVRIDAADVRSP